MYTRELCKGGAQNFLSPILSICRSEARALTVYLMNGGIAKDSFQFQEFLRARQRSIRGRFPDCL